jgi:hypothetical protein
MNWLNLKEKNNNSYWNRSCGSNGFFLFDERARKLISQKDYLVEPIVESPKNLYNQCDGLAFTQDDFQSKKTYIGFRPQVRLQTPLICF